MPTQRGARTGATLLPVDSEHNAVFQCLEGHPHTGLRRIDEASRFVDLNQLCLSPQCGFASTEEGNTLSEQQQWDKLRFVVEVAEEVWGK